MKNTINASVQAENELITISKNEIAGKIENTVNARELHKKLGSKRQFANWIYERIKKYGFIENIDFNKIVKVQENNKTEYFLTIDMAKEIAMVENNDIGRKIRRYFIEIEKNLKNQKVELPEDAHGCLDLNLRSALRAWTLYEEQIKGLEEKLKEYENYKEEVKKLREENEKLQNNTKLLTQGQLFDEKNKNFTVPEVAKIFNISRNDFYKKLREHKFLKLNNEPYKIYDGKYFFVKNVRLGKVKKSSYKKTFVTKSGFEFLKSNLNLKN